jgi:general secretion pathway protein K
MRASLKSIRRRRAGQLGAALLLAMVILTLVATLAAGMVWQHTRAINVEAAERARMQSAWILAGALDWARLILGEDRAGVDHLGEPWAVPLAESRLSTFLQAQGGSTNVADNDEGAPDAFLSGSIVDAQSRWNLRSLITADGKIIDTQLAVLTRLADFAGAPSGLATQLSAAYQAAQAGALRGAALAPRTLSDLKWLGVDEATLSLLEPFVVVLPSATTVNVNTAPREVIAAVANVSLGQAQSLVDVRQSKPFDSDSEIKRALGLDDTRGLDIKTSYFIVNGRLRLDDSVLEESSIVQRSGGARSVRSIQRLRTSRVDAAAQAPNATIR